MQASSIHEALAWAASEIDSDTARLDAEILLAYVLEESRSFLYTWPDKLLDDTQANEFGFLVLERSRGKPVAYLTGEQEFWSLSLKVTPSVLIPRPETEDMLRFILDSFDTTARKVIDIGTGSGAIALALAIERPEWNVMASDISIDALAVAEDNFQRFSKQLRCVESDLFESIPDKDFDIVVSNPPYIAEDDKHLERLMHEPKQALAAGQDGLQLIKKLLPEAFSALKPGGSCVLEHAYDQGDMVKVLLQQTGFFDVSCEKDLAGNDRFCHGVKPHE